MLVPILNGVFAKENKGLGGCPSYSYVMMFKILILQRIYNIADDQTEYQINDRMSFMRFIGLSLEDIVPDARWTTKNKEPHYGYKDHVKVDVTRKIITDYSVTAASIYDSQEIIAHLKESGKVCYADSAYSVAPLSEKLPVFFENRIHEKGYGIPT